MAGRFWNAVGIAVWPSGVLLAMNPEGRLKGEWVT